VAVALENVRLNREAAEIQVLREVDRLRSELIGNVSHELRTPLGLIKILASTLLRKDVIFDRETQLDLLRDIDDEADKLGRIVDNLLGASRIERGRLRLARQYEDLGGLMSEVLQAIAIQYPRHRFVQEFPAEPLLAPVDVLSLEQVMRNLLDNAAKYSPMGSTVTIRGGVDQGQALIQVVDEGPGVPDEAIERVFERFYRVDNEITRQTRGIGLGLPVCREIIESHGGLIWVESAPGEGSTFSFTLPLHVKGDGLDELVAMRA
jgi:two-component system sensor histidine kinase KdpD